MIRDFPKWWAFLTYDEFKAHTNVTEGLGKFAEDRITVKKEEEGTRNFNKAYDKLQAKQDKGQTRQLLEFGMEEGSCPDKPVKTHRDHLYSHPKHS